MAFCYGLGSAWSLHIPEEVGEEVKGSPGMPACHTEAKLIPGEANSTLKSLVAYTTLKKIFFKKEF